MFLQSCCGILQEAKRSHRAQLTGRLSNRNRLSRSDSGKGREKAGSEDGFLLGDFAPKATEPPATFVAESWYTPAVMEVWTSNEDFMPFRTKSLRSPSMVATGQRSAVRAAEESLGGSNWPSGEMTDPVTEDNIALSLRVVRGQDWQWGDEDGGPGSVGIVLSFDRKSLTAQVLWEKTSQAHSHYRYTKSNSKTSDLMIFQPALCPSVPSLGRRNSQDFFASKFQTVIVLDWDDTLFPTSSLRDELRVSWKAWQENLAPKLKDEIGSKLAICQTKVIDLLTLASSMGKVILVTLARKPWVFDSCRNFFPSLGQSITELSVPIIYAQEGAVFDYNKFATKNPSDVENFWSAMKAKAITRECYNFYSQYEGQSWKNVISIGDSDFERIGTMLATKDYMAQTGIREANSAVVDDHVYKVRTKTLKMIEQPTLDELNTQLGLLRAWLPQMVKLDSDFDLNLNTAADPTVLKHINDTLRGPPGPEMGHEAS